MSDAAPASEETLRQAKKALRDAILARRDSLDPALRRRHSQIITDKLLALQPFRSAEVVCAYASFSSEFVTSAFLSAVKDSGKRLLLPRINRATRTLELREASDPASDLVPGVWGIREPSELCPIVPASEADFLLVPGVAFAANGARLGYGGGFYDRLLAAISLDIPRIAAAFALQIVDSIPTGSRDQPVHLIVTETGEVHPHP
jgi:5-formyltetrahydrofolate cyclo-ligase